MPTQDKLRTVRVALIQTCNAYRHMPELVTQLGELAGRLDELRDANLQHHLDLIAQARAAGAEVIGLGELFSGPYFALGQDPLWLGLAESAETGPSIVAMQKAAVEHAVVIVAPIYERADEHTCFNTAVVIDADGTILGRYRKTHIPCGSNESGSFHETFYYGASRGNLSNDPARLSSSNAYFPVFETAVGRVGVAICYDRHFEGVMSSLAAGGAELVFSPAVTFGQKSQRMWPLEFEVDAARHGLFIAGSNRLGIEAPWNQPYFGESHVVGPQGRLPNLSKQPEIVICDAPLGSLGGTDPSGWRLGDDLRRGIYG
jgi:N-carbamoylputrescine amidase